MTAVEVLRLVVDVRASYPDLWVGVNLLSRGPAQALAESLDSCEGRMDGIWSDNAEADAAAFLNPAKSAIQEVKGLANMRLVLFDAVQFGGQFIVMYERTKEQLVEIQDKQIWAMAEKYRALIALQEDIHNKKRNESDPEL